MQPHPDLPGMVMFDDADLEPFIGQISSRDTIHAWTLSCVQKIERPDGKAFAYKAQLPPTLEPEFYDSATSPLLTGHQNLGRHGDCVTMLLDWLDLPRLTEDYRSEDELVHHAKQLVAQIGEITGNPPVYLDLGSAASWSVASADAVANLRRLIGLGKLPELTPTMVDDVEAWATSTPVRQLLTTSRLVHGDLKAEQIFVAPDGYRIIDWQRPLTAPPNVDLVTLLTDLGIDPRQHVDKDTYGMAYFPLLHWSVVARFDAWINDGDFSEWAMTAVRAILD